MRVLVTGANGFIGRSVCKYLAQSGLTVIGAVRSPVTIKGAASIIVKPDIRPDTNWSELLDNINCVVHLAANTHAIHKLDSDQIAASRQVNVDGALHLAEAAAEAGVKRFIFMSSIKVNGEQTFDSPFCEDDTPGPIDPYAVSKWDAEQGFKKIAANTSMRAISLRIPLAYGPGVKGNFNSLMRLIATNLPLPLGSINNKRSLIYVENLSDAICTLVNRKTVAHDVYMLSDGEDISTSALVESLSKAMGHRPILLAVPKSLLFMMAWLVRRKPKISMLYDSLCVNSDRFREEFSWSPPTGIQDGLKKTVEWYLGDGKK